MIVLSNYRSPSVIITLYEAVFGVVSEKFMIIQHIIFFIKLYLLLTVKSTFVNLGYEKSQEEY